MILKLFSPHPLKGTSLDCEKMAVVIQRLDRVRNRQSENQKYIVNAAALCAEQKN